MEHAETLTSLDIISTNMGNKDLKFSHEVHQDFGSMWLKFQHLKPLIKKYIAKISNDLFERAKP